nr:hypothetical protein [uncultured Ruegeria sp.]
MPKSKVFRFCLGTPEVPQSEVWRLVVNKAGDVVLINLKEMGGSSHVSFHASGQCHMRMNQGNRSDIPAPKLIDDRLIAFRLFYRELDNPLQPIIESPSKVAGKIRWAGPMQKSGKTIVEVAYRCPGEPLVVPQNVCVLYDDIQATMFRRQMTLSVICVHDQLSERDRQTIAQNGRERIGLPATFQDSANYFRLGKTDDGVAAIFFEEFSIG